MNNAYGPSLGGVNVLELDFVTAWCRDCGAYSRHRFVEKDDEPIIACTYHRDALSVVLDLEQTRDRRERRRRFLAGLGVTKP